MILSDFNRTAVASPITTLRDVLALHRRVCVLRHHGRENEASSLQDGELNQQIERLCAEGLSSHDEISAAFSQETRRVEDAALLASLIAPLIAEHLQMGNTAVAPAIIPFGKPAANPRVRQTPPGNIAGFIDEMLVNKNSSGKS